MYYVLGLLAIGVMIIVHELGHYVMAKVNGVKVLEFSIGFGPKIIKYQGKETLFSIALLPVGGYVNMLGSMEDNKEDEENDIEQESEDRYFKNKSPLQRFSIIIAGPLMNIILAIVLFSAFYTHFGYPDTTLSQIQEQSAAQKIGLESGDKIIGINGGKVFTTDDVNIEIGLSKGETMNIEFERDGNKVEKSITPKYNEEAGKYMLGVVFGFVENPTFVDGLKHSLNETATIVTNNYKVISNLVQGKGNLKTDVGGPVAIMQISSTAAKAGIWNLTYLIAVMSAGLGIINLLPLPVLDGGNCILILIELITRRKVPDKVVGVLNTIGFVFLFGVMILVTVKDILFPMNF